MLESIVAVTILVGDVAVAERAYAETLQYRVVERGSISAAQGAVWGAAGLVGRDYVLMQPGSAEPVYLRFVDTDAPPTSALRHPGWNATELLVEDPRQLAPRIEGSSFRVIGAPEPLSMNPQVIAMQAVGPAWELLYFTRIPPGQSRFGLGSASSFVDRVFIVVLGSQDLAVTLDFYRTEFEMPVTEPQPATIEVLRRAWQLPEGHQFPVAVVRLPQRFLIEVDGYPAAAVPRLPTGDGLPYGMAAVSFEVPALEPHLDRLIAAPRRLDQAPYAGRRVGALRGPSGELIELIETPR